MHGNRLNRTDDGGDYVTIKDFHGFLPSTDSMDAQVDWNSLAGRTLETRVYDTPAENDFAFLTKDEVSATVTQPYLIKTATRTSPVTINANIIRDQVAWTWSRDKNGDPRTTQIRSGWDDRGRSTYVSDEGQQGNDTDDSCTRTSYATGESPANWMLSYPTRQLVTSVTCDKAESNAGDLDPNLIIADNRTAYDSPLQTGDILSTSGLKGVANGNTTVQAKIAYAYDGRGRTTESKEIGDPGTATDDRVTKVQYVDTAGGWPLTVATTTPPTLAAPNGMKAITTLSTRGLPISVQDQNGYVTGANTTSSAGSPRCGGRTARRLPTRILRRPSTPTRTCPPTTCRPRSGPRR